jgi:hypothetical protein
MALQMMFEQEFTTGIKAPLPRSESDVLQSREGGPPKKRRKMDSSNKDARAAIQAVMGRFSAWRLDMARFSASANRALPRGDLLLMDARCLSIQEELMAARTDLTVTLAEAPEKIAGHSRVVDVVRALDNIDTSLVELRMRLAVANGRPPSAEGQERGQ